LGIVSLHDIYRLASEVGFSEVPLEWSFPLPYTLSAIKLRSGVTDTH
jgi:hypothetical protein